MTGEEIRRIITADYENAKQLLENNRIFRVTAINENEESTESDFKTSGEAIEFFEQARDKAKECFLDVLTDEVEFNGKVFPLMHNEIANHLDQRLRKESNYVPVQQFNRAFVGKMLEGSTVKMTEQEERIANKIVKELVQIDYPL
jgi:hypothetical protein